MFTGLIEHVGDVVRAVDSGKQRRLVIRCPIRDYEKGESISVNGACLTVEAFAAGEFTAYASGETISRTNIGKLAPGSKVNLERALALGDRLGGHIVSGHVDCLAKVADRGQAGESTRFVIAYPAEHSPLVVEKGSAALDGISLTVNECGEGWLAVNIIPATLSETTMGDWRPGREINLELDIVGKYVQSLTAPYAKAAGAKAAGSKTDGGEGGVTMDMLRRYGF